MNLNLENKNVVITGSTSGIGYYAAKSFLNEGAKVLLSGRNEKKMDNSYKQLSELYGAKNILKFQGDLTERETITSFRTLINKEMKNIDCLVINIGTGKPIRNNPLDIGEWTEMFRVNLFSAVQLVDETDGLWDCKKAGSIIMVSSIAGQDILSAPPAYAAAKDGLKVLAKYLSDRYAPRGIRVNSVSPGNVFFEGGRWEELLSEDEKAVNSYINEKVPLKRFASPEEVADVIVFLSSDRASFITGSNLVIDGGQRRGI